MDGYGNSEGVGKVSKTKFFKGKYPAKLEFLEGWSGGGGNKGGTQPKEPSMGKVWVFSGITLSEPFCGSY